MTSINLQKKFEKDRKPRFIAKNFDDFKKELLNYAKANFNEKINDFSEASLGGMLLDFAAYVGESMSFYTDQQMAELDYELAVNPDNIARHLKKAGIKNLGKSNALVKGTLTLVVDIDEDEYLSSGQIKANKLLLPKIKSGTQVKSTNSINFYLNEDIDFSKEDYAIEEVIRDEEDLPNFVVISKDGVFYSGEIATEVVDFTTEDRELFLTYVLENEDVVEIVSVLDENGNEFYEVEFLSQDTVYRSIKDFDTEYFQVEPAPRRFVVEKNYTTNKTYLRFGNGNGSSIKNDILTNPSDIALPIKGRSYLSRYSLDPKNLLNNKSFGISPAGNVLTIKYRYGGGSDHNIDVGDLSSIVNVVSEFNNIEQIQNLQNDTKTLIKENIIDTLSISNSEQAVGGSDGFSLEEARALIPTYMKMQNRVVNAEDLLSRIYTMPTNFGKIYRATVENNPYSNSTKDLFIICKNGRGNLAYANDAVKINIKNYLNELRVIGDEINIVDAPIFNISIDISIKVKNNFDIDTTLENVYENIINNLESTNMSIGQGVNVNNIVQVVLSTDGVLSITTAMEDIVKIRTKDNEMYSFNLDEDLTYSNNSLSVYDNFKNGIIYPPRGGIFELKYILDDILVRNS